MAAGVANVGKGLKPLLLATALAMGLNGAVAMAQTGATVQAIDIPAGDLAQALDRLGEQAGVLITYEPGLVRGLRARPVSGQMPVRAALERLLEGLEIELQVVNDRTFVLKRQRASLPARPAPSPRPARAPVDERTVTDLQQVAVTGSRIRGGDTPSPVVTIDAERIREEGFTDLGEVIRSISQNYNGGQNPGVINGQAGNVANVNLGGGSSLNLRGLGPDATLTLLNGRRLAYGGLYQSVDIGAIPVEAVQRIEIVADGASAIYGSDAVGGVGNVILKRDFEGIRLGAKYGRATEGGLGTRELTATTGTTWASGGVIAAFKDASVDPIYADQREYTRFLDDPTTIYPGSDATSGLVSAFQALGERAELRLDAFVVEREQHVNVGRPAFFATTTATTDNWFVSPSLEIFLSGDWTIDAGASRSHDEFVQRAVLTYPDGANTVSGDSAYRNRNTTYEAGAEGPLFSTGGGDARLAVGLGYRDNTFHQFNRLTQVVSMAAQEGSRFAYAEVNIPLVSEANRRALAYRLSLTAAVRAEDYDSFGRVNTPKLGLVYGINADFSMKASWGKSFKAPTLVQLNGPQFAHLELASSYGPGYPVGATVLSTSGSNPDIGPERATTWTASLVFHPSALPDFSAELSLFEIDYTDKVTNPITSRDGLTNPLYASFVTFSPTAAQLAAALAPAQFMNISGVAYDPAAVIALMDRRQTNVNRQRVRGFDLSGDYGFDLGGGRLVVRGSASWLDSDQQTIANQSWMDLSGTIYHPAKHKSRVGAVWSRNAFTTSGFVNHTDGVVNAVAAEKTGSFTTMDAMVRYRVAERSGFWSGVEFSLAANNLLNRDPPSHTSTSLIAAHFDSTNYSAIGRFLSASIAKHW